mgnify:CR=1 FL=1
MDLEDGKIGPDDPIWLTKIQDILNQRSIMSITFFPRCTNGDYSVSVTFNDETSEHVNRPYLKGVYNTLAGYLERTYTAEKQELETKLKKIDNILRDFPVII